MSRFLNEVFSTLTPYIPGEQPKEGRLIKLNTNESPYPPSPGVLQAVTQQAANLQLYSDPTCSTVIRPLAETLGLCDENVFVGNGSDEVLAFLFQGFCAAGAAFADLTYGFYLVFAQLYGVKVKIIPLLPDFTLQPAQYRQLGSTIFIANPNAPTGLALGQRQIEEILNSNPNNLVVIDEAYVDFGAESAIPLLQQHLNLVVVSTFSKSRSLAGARLGYAAASAEVIAALNRIKFSFNPYNVNSMTLAAGAAALADADYYKQCQQNIVQTRNRTVQKLQELGFQCTNSRANFLFVHHPRHEAKNLYTTLRQNGILVRWFDTPRACNHLRITVGSPKDMETLCAVLTNIL